jgi:hypothetical protein
MPVYNLNAFIFSNLCQTQPGRAFGRPKTPVFGPENGWTPSKIGFSVGVRPIKNFDDNIIYLLLQH